MFVRCKNRQNNLFGKEICRKQSTIQGFLVNLRQITKINKSIWQQLTARK
jgi:hypothetical protein